MNKTEYKKALGKILYTMAEVFRDDVSDLLIEGWVAVLASEKVTIEEARAAAIQVMKSRMYNKLPTPAVFLEILRPQANQKELAEAQADKVLEAVRKVGYMEMPKFGDPITAELMRSRWRWHDFARDLLTEEIKWWRKDFTEAYCNAAKNNARPRLPEPKPRALLKETQEEVKG